jgi:hypothetical protein
MGVAATVTFMTDGVEFLTDLTEDSEFKIDIPDSTLSEMIKLADETGYKISTTSTDIDLDNLIDYLGDFRVGMVELSVSRHGIYIDLINKYDCSATIELSVNLGG